MHQLKRIKTGATSTKQGGNLVDVWKCNACKCQYEGAVGGPPPLPTDVCKPLPPAQPAPPVPATPAAPAKAEKKTSVKPQAPKT